MRTVAALAAVLLAAACAPPPPAGEPPPAGVASSDRTAATPAVGTAAPDTPPLDTLPRACAFGHDGPAVLPDPACAPGVADPAVTPENLDTTICRRGYTAGVRPPVTYTGPIKSALLAAYGAPGPLSAYELDHVIPLELGGHPRDPHNLWPQPAPEPGFHQKDALENWLHGQVCGGALPLRAAQAEIASDWYAAWVAAGRPA